MSQITYSFNVQFGCGLSAPETWHNYDVSPTLRLQKLPFVGKLVPSGPYGRFPQNVKYGDIVKGLPVPSESVDLLYCSHVLEHLSLDDLRLALRNCYHVVRPNGIFRLVLPDLEFFARQYLDASALEAAEEFMRVTYLGKLTRQRNLQGFLREWLGGSQHLWMWDYKSLAEELNTAGFREIRRASIGDSGITDFASVEDAGRWEDAFGDPVSPIVDRVMKVVICWSDISGYMAACWRALQNRAEIDLHVIAFQALTNSAFADDLMKGITCTLLDMQQRNDTAFIQQLVLAQEPEVVVTTGWFHRPYQRLAHTPALAQIPMVMGMDTPWRGDWRQRLAPWVLRRYLRRMDKIVVPGERSWQYARYLGVPVRQIMRGMYGIDYDAWSPLWLRRRQQSNLHSWPQAFLFVGRYVADKGVEVLIAAYNRYRDAVLDPWPLICCGQGELADHLQGQPGIEDRGFVQPADLWDIWAKAGVFVLPSRYDPWPLALVEAAASGLPIICTTACGSAVEVVRDGYSGLVVPKDDVAALAGAMVKMHQRHSQLSQWGERAQQLAAPYAAQVWAEHWSEMLLELPMAHGFEYGDV